MAKIEWDVEKGLLVVMTVLILAGVGFIVVKRSEISELTTALPTAENQLARIGKRYQEVALLEREVKADDMAQGARPIDYLYTQMTNSGIGKRAFTIEAPSNADKYTGYTDADWELRVKQGEKAFGRKAIATLLLYIEGNTNRMKVTRLRLTKDMSKGAEEDSWEPIITITDRSATAE